MEASSLFISFEVVGLDQAADGPDGSGKRRRIQNFHGRKLKYSFERR